MARQSTILKALTPDLNKGFTLIELIVGMAIFSIVGGLALNALVEAGKGFNDDKRNIESSQNLSAVLEMVGNDIKQAGEQISDSKFPVIVIEPADTGSMIGSSKITIRRALTTALTLCGDITAGSATTSLVVADQNLAATQSSCKVDPATLPTAPAPLQPTTLREARNYRCKLDNPNADYSSTTTDFCLSTTTSSSSEKVLAAMSTSSGVIWKFNYTNDSANIGTATIPKFSITIDNSTPSVGYSTATPIYLIEERIYTLDSNGNLKLQKDNGSTDILISGISSFNVSAKIYSDKVAKTINTTPANACTDADSLQYACTFTAGTDWKTLAGIKVKLQAKYDPTGRTTYTTTQLNDPNTTVPDILKLRAAAEYFPRNVLSK